MIVNNGQKNYTLQTAPAQTAADPAETRVRTVCYKVCRMVPETKVVNYTVCRMIPETRVRTVNCTVFPLRLSRGKPLDFPVQ